MAGAVMSRPHNFCEQRSEKHARTLDRERRPVRDPQVERLMRDGYNQQQIAALTGKSMIDVRLAMNAAGAFL